MPVIRPLADHELLHRAKETKQKSAKHYFSRAVAKKTGHAIDAILLATLSMWQGQRVNEKSIGRLKENELWSFRSRTKLHKQLPYVGRSTITDSIQRLEKAGLVKLERTGRYNKRSYDKTSWFHVPPEVQKEYCQPKGAIRIGVSDACEFGICAAAILGNINFAHEEIDSSFSISETDYYPISPSYLSEYFGCFSVSTIKRAIPTLLQANRIKRHPSKKGYFCLIAETDLSEDNKISVGSNPTGTGSNPTDLGSNAADNTNEKENGNGNEKFKNSCPLSAPPQGAGGSSDEMLIANPIDQIPTLPPFPQDVQATARVKEVVESVKQATATAMQRMTAFKANPSFIAVDDDGNEVTHAGFTIDDLPFDDVSRWDHWSALRHDHVEMTAEQCKASGFPVTKSDRQKLLRLFSDNPKLRYDDLVPLLDGLMRFQAGEEEADVVGLSPEPSTDLFHSPEPKGDLLWYSLRVRSLSYFLEHLPEIVTEFGFPHDEPYRDINYSYLDESARRPHYYGEVFRSNQWVQLCYR